MLIRRALLSVLCYISVSPAYAVKSVNLQGSSFSSVFQTVSQLSSGNDTALIRLSLTGKKGSITVKPVPLNQQPGAQTPRMNRSAMQPIKNVLTTPQVMRHQRYQQYYKGLEVLGGEFVTHSSNLLGIGLFSNPRMNGTVYTELKVDDKAIETVKQDKVKAAVIKSAVTHFKTTHAGNDWIVSDVNARLLLGVARKQSHFIYHVRFHAVPDVGMPREQHALVDAAKPEHFYSEWNSLHHLFVDKGPGGNEKTGRYVYGENGLPGLPSAHISPQQNRCLMRTPTVSVVNFAENGAGYDPNKRNPFEYACAGERRDRANGGYSPADDAFLFGHMVIEMYQTWYQEKALPIPLVLRVHLPDPYHPDNRYYANAFWDDSTNTMNFGDGDPYQFYPLTTLGVTAHEVSHGFTQYHSDLFYGLLKSASLNESFSDMASIAVKAYVHEQYPALYEAITVKDEDIWILGASVTKHRWGFRDMRHPHHDPLTPECFHSVESCPLSFDNLPIYEPHIVAGIFNRAFYILANKPGWNIKKAFHVMMVANRDGYWTSGRGLEQLDFFENAASGVVSAARDLGYNENDVKAAFQETGLLMIEKG